MKQTIYKHEFIEAFDKMDRGNNFSRIGRELLFEYFEELEDDLGEEIELDVIAICCEYSEDTLQDFLTYYRLEEELSQALKDGCICDVDNNDLKEWIEEETGCNVISVHDINEECFVLYENF